MSEKLDKIKQQLKDWEQRFFKKHNRKPDKNDIKNRPDVAKRYHDYHHLKKSLDSSVIQPSPAKQSQKSILLSFEDYKPEKRPLNLLDIEPKPSLDIEPKRIKQSVPDFFLSQDFITESKVESPLKSDKLALQSMLSKKNLTFREPSKVQETENQKSIFSNTKLQSWNSRESFQRVNSLDSVVRPNVHVKSFKRQASWTALPIDMCKELLDKEDLQMFSKVFNEPASECPDLENADQVAAEEVPKENSNSGNESPEEKENQNPRKTKRSTRSSGNFRKLKLKGKKNGRLKRIGNKFHQTRKLESYNYKKSDDSSFLGYDSEDDNSEVIEMIATKNVTNSDEFIFFEKHKQDLVELAERFSSNCYVDAVEALNSLTGISAFRPGQLEAITRLLSGISTLLVLPTGMGKSLVYQLSAFIISKVAKKLTVVISPTISLINDQLQNLPKGLRGCCITASNVAKVFEKIENGEIDVLFISPERFASPNFVRDLQKFPISFFCIDEAHCMSEWSHNFRTAYLNLPRILQSFDCCILAMTGTATTRVQKLICDTLSISEENVVNSGRIRDNLFLKVIDVESNDRDGLLLEILKSPDFVDLKSIIIYVSFQNQADLLSQYLRIRSIDAESYHAGKALEARDYIQKQFLSGRLRVIVATVAFGLGINKENVDSVIHYTMPRSIENYTQEIGRAGRNGKNAQCIVLLVKDDYVKHRSLSFSDSVDEFQVKKLLVRLCKNNFVWFNVQEYEKEYDIKEKTIESLLCYLQAEYPDYVQVLPSQMATISIWKKSEDLEFLQPIKMTRGSRGEMVFNLFEASITLDMDCHQVLSTLWDLQKKKLLRFTSAEKMFSLRFQKLFPRDMMDSVVKAITDKLCKLELNKVEKLDQCYETLLLGAKDFDEWNQLPTFSTSQELMATLNEYFEQEKLDTKKGGFRDPDLLVRQKQCKALIELSIKEFVKSNPTISARSMAKIFHGIPSPSYPTSNWQNTEYWKKFNHYYFEGLVKMAQIVIDKNKGKK